MKSVVLDSFGLLAFLRNETGAEVVKNYLEQALSGKVSMWMSSVNWAEVGYIVIRKRGLPGWRKTEALLHDLPLSVVETTPELTDQAAQFKAAHKMSLADAYAAALAKTTKADLVTGDPEFKAVAKNLPKVVWLDKR